MQRRLEDVSHFFFDPRAAAQSDHPSREPQRAAPSSRMVYVASRSDHITAAVIVAGLAVSATRIGRRVLVAETHEQPFGVAFVLGTLSGPGQSVIAQTASDLGVVREPLLGSSRPGRVFDARARWEEDAASADVVLVHVNHAGGISPAAGLPVPHEYFIVANDDGRDESLDVYRTIKRTVLWSPHVTLGVIAVGSRHRQEGAPVKKLIQAVGMFLGRPCSVVGLASSGSALAQTVLAGDVERDGWDDLVNGLSAITDRWRGSDTKSEQPIRLPGPRPAGEGADDRRESERRHGDIRW